MADMFGAPVGILASDQNIRQNILSGFGALKTLGEIEQQPIDLKLKQAELPLREAQTRHQNALALGEEAKAQDLLTMQALEANIARARAQGVDLTVEDVTRASNPNPSLADPIEQMYRLGIDSGAPARLLMPLAEKAALIRQREASAASAQAEQEVRLLDATKKRAERQGALASSGLQSQQAYDQMRMMAASEGLPIDHLPENLEEARPLLQNIVSASIDAKDKAELAIKERQQKSREARVLAEDRKANAYVARATQAVKNARQVYNLRAKNDGDMSAGAAEARVVLNRRRQQLIDAQNRKDFPPAPLDPSARQVGQSYTAADGRTRFQWVKDPATGQNRAMLLGAAPARSSTAAPADDTPDDGDNEDDE